MIKLEHELYKAREVAELLRLNTKTLYGWIARGEVAVIRTPGGGIRVTREELVRLLGRYGEVGEVAGGEGVDKHLPHE
jgi:excisionase family DNA binding protein